MVGFLKGRCTLGAACNFPTHELRPEHKCIQYSQVIHIMCGTFDFENDRYQCKIDCRKEQHAHTSTPTTSTAPPSIPLLSPIINPAPTVEHFKTTTPAATITTKEIKATTTSCCPKCGGHDHLRSSSKKCKFYKTRTPSKTKSSHHRQPYLAASS